MKSRLFLILFILLSFSIQAQKVGVVLSGGGARGIAHVGVLQALEENNIPIDYITGTSMGAIVGGLYSIGMSPQDILHLVSSEEFLTWSTGVVQNKDIDHFKKEDPTPTIFSTYISLKDTSISKILTSVIPTSVINPIHLNFHYMELFGPYSAMCGGDFDKLFVPFRCVAADVYTRRPVTFNHGNVEDAIRASMSIPIVFNPVVLDSLLLFDGGLYNNYPVDVMEKDFSPDFTIGSTVAFISNDKPGTNDLYAQLEYLIMNPTTSEIPKEDGLELSMDLKNISILQFELADSIYQIGYDKAMSMMDSIKKQISRRVDADSLIAVRKQFRAQAPSLLFYDIEYRHVNEAQKEYISQIIRFDKEKGLSVEDFRKVYYRLLSDDRISEIVPKAIYNPEKQMYKLVLDFKIKSNIVFSLGGNISSHTDNQLYANIGYHNMGRRMNYVNWDANMGNKFTSSNISYRMDMAGKRDSYLAGKIGFSLYKYYEGEKMFYEDFSTAFIREREFSLRLRYGISVFKQSKLEFGYGAGRISNSYMQELIDNFTEESFDKSIYDLQSYSVKIEQNTLNHRLYPTEGQKYKVQAQYITGWEYYSYPDSIGSLFKERQKLDYLQFSAAYEAYHLFGKHFSLGYSADAIYNNKRSLDNYMASIIQAPAFTPTPFSKARFNDAFRANKYIAVGIKPIYMLNSLFNIQLECYGFMPIESMRRGVNQETLYSTSLQNFQYMGELSLLLNQPFFSTALFLHHSSYPRNDWNVGLNIGFLLLPASFLE